MSSKFPRPKKPVDPATKKTTRGDIINFMNYMSTDENFCLRVWNTVQAVHERAVAEAAKEAEDGIEGGRSQSVPRPIPTGEVGQLSDLDHSPVLAANAHYVWLCDGCGKTYPADWDVDAHRTETGHDPVGRPRSWFAAGQIAERTGELLKVVDQMHGYAPA